MSVNIRRLMRSRFSGAVQLAVRPTARRSLMRAWLRSHPLHRQWGLPGFRSAAQWRGMRIHRTILALALATGLAGVAHADPVGVVKESGRTAGEATKDGVLTFGRTTRDFFTEGTQSAKHTWR